MRDKEARSSIAYEKKMRREQLDRQLDRHADLFLRVNRIEDALWPLSLLNGEQARYGAKRKREYAILVQIAELQLELDQLRLELEKGRQNG